MRSHELAALKQLGAKPTIIERRDTPPSSLSELSALFDGLVWGEPPTSPSPFLARSIYPPDHAFTTVDGRLAAATWESATRTRLRPSRRATS